MLENLKGSYFIKIIFSFIYEGTRLKLVKFNKNFQAKIDIDINDYKTWNEKKVIINEGNGKAREYDSSNCLLLYEGEYLNGKRNGKGREYYFLSCYLKYEGEYLDGKRNGKGKEYFNYKLIFDGEYLNGKKWKGLFYEYNDKGKLISEGYYLNGEKIIKKKQNIKKMNKNKFDVPNFFFKYNNYYYFIFIFI